MTSNSIDDGVIVSRMEHAIGNDMAIKVQVRDGVGPKQFAQIGERVASEECGRYARIWVWVYGADMDLDGPAVCVSYMDSSAEAPVSEYADPTELATWYLARGLEA